MTTSTASAHKVDTGPSSTSVPDSSSSLPDIDPKIKKEALSRAVKFAHLSSGMSIIAGYSATALFISSTLALGLTSMAWAIIGGSAVLLAILFVALQNKAQKQAGIPTDLSSEIFRNLMNAVIWPFALYVLISDLIEQKNKQ